MLKLLGRRAASVVLGTALLVSGGAMALEAGPAQATKVKCDDLGPNPDLVFKDGSDFCWGRNDPNPTPVNKSAPLGVHLKGASHVIVYFYRTCSSGGCTAEQQVSFTGCYTSHSLNGYAYVTRVYATTFPGC